MHKILVVDDEPDIRAELSDYLERKGFSTSCAKDGVEAMCLFDSEKFSAIVTDVKMPRRDGHELIRLIRQRDTTLPIIALTGHYSADELDKVERMGATQTMKKPVRLRLLREALGRLLDNHTHF